MTYAAMDVVNGQVYRLGTDDTYWLSSPEMAMARCQVLASRGFVGVAVFALDGVNPPQQVSETLGI